MNLYIASLILTILTSTFSCYLTFKKRNIVGAKPLFALMVAVGVWAFSYIFEIISKSFEVKVLWYNFEYFGIAFIPVLWLSFALFYADANTKNVKRFLPFAFVIPVVIIALVWTNSFHSLFVKDMFIAESALVPVLLKTNALGYWLHISFSYAFIIAGTIIFLNTLFKLPQFFLKQGMLLIIGALLPAIFSIFNAFNINPFYPFDITPTVLSVSGILLTFSLLNLKTFQIAPFARDLFFDKLEDKILVIDNDLRIIDMNNSMQELFNIKLSDIIGLSSMDFLKSKGWDINLESDFKDKSLDFIAGGQEETLYYSVSKIPIIKNRESSRGFLIIFHEITIRKKIEKSLQDSNTKIISLNKYSFEINKADNSEEVVDKTSSALVDIFNLNNFCIFVFEGQKIVNKCSNCSYLIKKPMKEKMLKKLVSKYIDKNNNVFRKIKTSDFNGFSNITFIPMLDTGTAVFFSIRDAFLSKEDLELCELLLSYSAEALKRFKLQDILRQQAQKDPLTGCFNRRYFNEIIDKEIERAKRYNYPILFLMIDVNRFKEINDRFGHQAGDSTLADIGEILMRQVRKIDTVIRYGGDEFLVMLPGMNDLNFKGFVDRINEAVEKNDKKSKSIDFDISLSIGKSIYYPKLNEPMEKILHFADMDMYSKKNKRKEDIDNKNQE